MNAAIEKADKIRFLLSAMYRTMDTIVQEKDPETIKILFNGFQELHNEFTESLEDYKWMVINL